MILPETIPAPSAASITPEELKTLVSIYVVIVGHLAMREAENSRKTTGGVLGNFLRADRRRYKSLPGVVAQRKAETGQAWMGNREVQDAVDCKVKFRPQLASLLASNTEDVVESNTREAFASYDEDPSKSALVLKFLVSLQGIGPAAASLLLVIHDPASVPFFSDELFR